MKDVKEFNLSTEASNVADRLYETGKFSGVPEAVKFGFAYAIKNHYKDFNPATYDIQNKNGYYYAPGNTFSDLEPYMKAFYPDTDTPNLYMRALMDFGLLEIGKIIDENGALKIYSLCE